MKLSELILEYLKVIIWPSLILGIVLIFRKQIDSRIRDLQKADLPGGVSFSFRAEIQEAEKLSVQVSAEPSPQQQADGAKNLPLTEINLRMIKLGLQPSPSGLNVNYYRDLAAIDPNLSLAGLRLEIDVLTRNVAKGFKVPIEPQDSGYRLLRKLRDYGAVTNQQAELISKILRLTNAGVHGSVVMRDEANQIINIAEVLVDQYISWLNWGFNDGRKPSKAP